MEFHRCTKASGSRSTQRKWQWNEHFVERRAQRYFWVAIIHLGSLHFTAPGVGGWGLAFSSKHVGVSFVSRHSSSRPEEEASAQIDTFSIEWPRDIFSQEYPHHRVVPPFVSLSRPRRAYGASDAFLFPSVSFD